MTLAPLTVNGAHLAADPSGALWWPERRLLAVADLHLEKGSRFAARGALLPPYDTRATLDRLERLVLRLRPRLLVALGDSFHDPRAPERLAEADAARLRRLTGSCDWIWIAGNHDPAIPAGLGDMQDELALGPLIFRHEPKHGEAAGEIAGHLHPAARVVSPSGSLRRRCFVGHRTRCVLPAFGAYAGGLNIRHEAFAPLFGARPVTAHVLGRARVFAVGERYCIGD